MGIEALDAIHQVSVTENVAMRLRQAVLDGRLKPGMKLREQTLCEELGVSRTPLREAFRILQAERILDYEPYIGVKVARFSKKFLQESWEIRRLVESYAARLCAERLTEEDRAEYERMLRLMEQIDVKDVEKFEAWDEQFHFLLARKSGNNELEQMIVNLWTKTSFLRKIALFKSSNRAMASRVEHLDVLRAILSADAKEAESMMQLHFFRSEDDVAVSEFFASGEVEEEV